MDGILSVFIDHYAAHKYAENILCCFGCGWKGEVRENLRVFQGKAAAELYRENCFVFFPASFTYFAFGTVLHKM